MNKNELIEKLETISALYNDTVAIKKKMDSLVPEDNYAREVFLPEFPKANGDKGTADVLMGAVDHTSDSAKEEMSRAYEGVVALPKAPKEPEEQKFKKPDKPRVFNALSGACGALLAISIFCLFCGISIIGSKWGLILTILSVIGVTISCVLLVALLVIGLVVGKIKEASLKKSFDSRQEEIRNRYYDELSQHKCALDEYNQKRDAFLDEYIAWRAVYLEHLAEEERIKAQLEIDKQKAVAEIERTELIPAQERLNEANDLTSEEYLPVTNKLISLIQSGRADSLKDAINLYEEILYKERQLQLEREKEERRQYEAMLRLAAEQARHEEEMRLLAEQEYQRQREEAYRRQEEERRYREEENRRQAENERRQAEARREESRRQHEERVSMYREHNATQRQCNSCANVSHCRMAFSRPNCASYRPK